VQDYVPYFNKDIAAETCAELMKVGAPPPLNKLSFMLNAWKLSKIRAKRNATPLPSLISNHSDTCSANGDVVHETSTNGARTCNGDRRSNSNHGKLPIALYSHGLTGNAEIYSYQTMNLAANGIVVLSLTHTDGSAIGYQKEKDGPFIPYDHNIIKLWKKDNQTEYVRARRDKTSYRARELEAAAQALMKMNVENPVELEMLGISFVDKLDIEEFFVMGHSFGGATAISLAARKPDLFKYCVAHDPALDWMPDDVRRALLSNERFEGSDVPYHGGTGGYVEASDDTNHDDDHDSSSIHDLDLFFLYSHQWVKLKWGGPQFVQDLFKRAQFGRPGGPSNYGVVDKAQHSEFSDSCMKTPLWLARATGFTGPRNPIETAEEIAHRTLKFIEEARRSRKPTF